MGLPDRLTFQSDQSGFFDIVDVNVNGSNRVVLTAGLQPTLSPEGTRMAFIKGNGSGQELYVANANGTAQIRLTTDGGKDETPDWGAKPITFAPREQTITNVQAVPTGMTTTVTFKTSRPTNQALVQLRRDASFMRFNVDSARRRRKDHSHRGQLPRARRPVHRHGHRPEGPDRAARSWPRPGP